MTRLSVVTALLAVNSHHVKADAGFSARVLAEVRAKGL
jgi:hypothetical protein